MVGRKTITIRRERFYPHPPEDVWTAITDPHALAEWMEPNDHRPVVGHKFNFVIDPTVYGHVKECEVIEADPPRRLVWSWIHVPKNPNRPRPAPMTITWTLVPKDGGTLLILEHRGAENINWMLRNMMRFGWGYLMKRSIPKVLARVNAGIFTAGAIPLNKRGYTCKTVPEKFVR